MVGRSSSSSAIAELRSRLEPLRHLGLEESHSLYAAPEFVALREVCQKLYPGAGRKETLEFALSQAPRNLGLLIGGPRHTELDWAAKRIDAAFRQEVSRRTHLCPLDLADELPDVQFGPNQIRTFTAAELADVVDPDGLSHNLPQWQSNIRRLSWFAWLVVTESVSLPANPGARALPLLFENLDFDRIELHKPKFPVAVEAALFALLMVPWEDVTVYAKYEWRPFEVPWVHTIDDDLFARRMVVPDANALNWAPDEERPERRLKLNSSPTSRWWKPPLGRRWTTISAPDQNSGAKTQAPQTEFLGELPGSFMMPERGNATVSFSRNEVTFCMARLGALYQANPDWMLAGSRDAAFAL
jgi:hypothetical protein